MLYFGHKLWESQFFCFSTKTFTVYFIWHFIQSGFFRNRPILLANETGYVKFYSTVLEL